MQRPAPSGLARTGITILSMLFIGILCFGVAVNFYWVGTKVGLSLAAAKQLPNYAFFFGAALGLGVRTIYWVRVIVGCVAAMTVVGLVGGIIGAVIEATAESLGLNPDAASWIQPIAFWLGFGSLGVFIYVTHVRRRRAATQAIEK